MKKSPEYPFNMLIISDTVEAYESGKLAKLLGIHPRENDDL